MLGEFVVGRAELQNLSERGYLVSCGQSVTFMKFKKGEQLKKPVTGKCQSIFLLSIFVSNSDSLALVLLLTISGCFLPTVFPIFLSFNKDVFLFLVSNEV